MELKDLFDKEWNSHEENRFLDDDPKHSTEDFDAESFKHDGFEDREKYFETYVPALADETRLHQELNDFTPPRLYKINRSPYQALVIRYGVLRTLIRQPNYNMGRSELLDEVKAWQEDIINEFEDVDFPNDDELLHLATAATNYNNDIDDAELNLLYQFFEVRNEGQKWTHEQTNWLDFFHRLSSIERFPKVSRSQKPSHALDTIKQGLWSLQDQAIVYEVVDADEGNLVGIPEDYADYIRDWLPYEISQENYIEMLESLDPFDHRDNLLDARNTFSIEAPNQGRNDKRRENIVEAGIYPSDLFSEVLSKEDLKEIVDEYGLDAHKRRTDEMIEATIKYFDRSQAGVEREEPTAELYLKTYEEIADGDVDMVPPQIQNIVDEESPSDKLDVLFELATSEIFEEIFNLDGTELLGQKAGGNVADGEIQQDGEWLLWDNKRRVGEFKLDANTRAKIKDYIDRKKQQHDVKWFLIIAPDFADSAADNAVTLESQVGVDVRLVRAEDFQELANIWQEDFDGDDKELPLSVFTGATDLKINQAENILESHFS